MPNELANTAYQTFTGAAAIAETLAPGEKFRLIRVEFKISSAPTTSENCTITVDAGDGSAYDILIYSKDWSATSVVAEVVTFGNGYEYEADDEIDIAYTNTDTRTISGRYVYELIK